MSNKTQRLTAIFLAALAAAALACNTLSPGGPTAAPAPTKTAVAVIEDMWTAAPPTEAPATEAAPTEAAPTGPALQLVVAGPDGQPYLLDLDGTRHDVSEMQEPLYLFTYHLETEPALTARAYNVSSAGVFPLDAVGTVGQGFAAYVGPAAPNGLLAWDSYSIDPAGGLVGQIHLTSPDGSVQSVAYEETSLTSVLRVWRWAADGQHLYFSKEPLGLGGYIPFAGITNIWELNTADGSVREVVPTGSGIICIDDLAADLSLAAHHCNQGTVGVFAPGGGLAGTITPPPEAEALLLGDVRLSPDHSRVAFAMALGNPEAEVGWVAVSDGLDGAAHLAAQADAAGYFNVVQWLDNATLLLQSQGANPGVYIAQADGSAAAQRLGDGYLLGVIDNVAGQP